MKIFLMNWNWFTWAKKQADYLASCGHEVIIVDNGSTYAPLLQWYASNEYEVIEAKGGYNRHVWEMDLHNRFTDNYYGVTDADLNLDAIPADFAQVLIADLERSEGIVKSGFSIRIHDLPDNPYANRYRESEKGNFKQVDRWGFYHHPLDTTFAVYSKERCNNLHKFWHAPNTTPGTSFLDERYFFTAHRAPEPYACRHMPWYLDINNLTDEQLYHISIAQHGSVAHFKSVYQEELKKYAIGNGQ